MTHRYHSAERPRLLWPFLFALVVLAARPATAQEAAPAPTIVEAEGGELGAEFETASDGPTTYITTTTDYNETTGTADTPGANRTATYEVTFPGADDYAVYARMHVGAETFNDDSFFFGAAFGERDPDVAEDWFRVNGLAAGGYSGPTAYVDSVGGATSEEWKWVRLSGWADVSVGPFAAEDGALTQTFAIGARENGLWIDKFAFAPANAFYTVENLDNAEPGVFEIPPDFQPTGPPLAEGLDKWLGVGWDPLQDENVEFYWNQITPGNGGKWGWVEGTRDQMNWADADSAYALAKRNGWPFRYHVLVWGSQQPQWVANLPADEQIAELREWMQAVAARYPDIDYLEVVNEPLPGHNQPDDRGPDTGNYIDALNDLEDHGTQWDWVINAFTMAKEYFPDTPLVINDFNILSSTGAARNYREIVELLQERDLIDVIGMQGHAFSTRQGAPITQVLDLLAETGLPLMVTEVDVDGNETRDPFMSAEQSDANQLRDMQRIFPLLWEHPDVIGVTMWGWRPPVWRQDADAYLVNDDGTERPALVWLRDYLNDFRTAGEDGPTAGALGLAAFPNPFAGSAEVRFTLGAAADVTLTVYDALGREVATLADGPRTAGAHGATFEAAGLPSGLYLVRLEAGPVVETRPIVLAR